MMDDRFKSVPLRAAQVEYFRIPRHHWGLALTRVHQMGANTVSISLYWGWHEIAEGQFDLQGQTDPRRDLSGFVNLCAEMGFQLILRIGPAIGGGVLGGGIPAWLLRQHPEIRALRADGTPCQDDDTGQPRLCHTHPLYLSYVRRWYEQVAGLLSSLQWPAGPIVALQVDNRIASTTADHRGDYNPHVTTTLWPVWLRKRYGSIAALNQAYGTSYASFSTQTRLPVPALREGHKPTTIQELRQCADADRFTDWSLAYGLLTYVNMLRAVGWTVPLYHNLGRACWKTAGLPADLSSLAQACGWLSQDMPADRAAGEAFNLAQYVHDVHWRTQLLRSDAPHCPAFISQAPAGQAFALYAPYVGGLEAMAIYPAVETNPDPPDVGSFLSWGSDAPVRADGSVSLSTRPGFWNAQILFTCLAAGGDDWAGGHAAPADVALGYSKLSEGAERVPIARSPTPAQLARESNIGCRSQRIAQQLVRHQVRFDVVDIDRASAPAERAMLSRYPMLIVPASLVMSREAQQALAEYAQQGGHLIMVGESLPAYDESFEPCNVLRSQAGEQIQQVSEPGDVTHPDRAQGEQVWPVSALETLLASPPPGVRLRMAWADVSTVDVGIRYGVGHENTPTIYLTVANLGPDDYAGAVHYIRPGVSERPSVSERHSQGQVHVRLGSMCVGFVALRQGQVLSAILANASPGPRGGQVRTRQNRFAFDGSLGVAATIENAVVLSAQGTGTFHLSRKEGWEGFTAWHMLLDGRIVEGPVHVQGKTIAVAYPTRGDSHDGTAGVDRVFLVPAQQPLAQGVRQYLEGACACRRGVLREAARFAEALHTQLSDVELRAASRPPDAAPASPTQDALSRAVRSVDKAARYADHLRDRLEGRAAAQAPDAELERVWMTDQALADMIALREIAREAGALIDKLLAEAAGKPGLPRNLFRTHPADAPPADASQACAQNVLRAYLCALDETMSTVTSLRRRLGDLLVRLRSALQAHHVERTFGERVERALSHLLYVLSNLALANGFGANKFAREA